MHLMRLIILHLGHNIFTLQLLLRVTAYNLHNHKKLPPPTVKLVTESVNCNTNNQIANKSRNVHKCCFCYTID